MVNAACMKYARQAIHDAVFICSNKYLVRNAKLVCGIPFLDLHGPLAIVVLEGD
jgi:hypothetical protein